MSTDPSIRPDPIQPTGPGAERPAQKNTDGAAFRALLEKLEANARELGTERPSTPAEVAALVERAQNSIDAAASLGDELLEAYRAARQRAEGAEGTDGKGGQG